MAGPAAYAWMGSPWWAQAQPYFQGVPGYVPAVIAQAESGGTPSALGDFFTGYDNQGNPTFSQTGGGKATSFGVFQLHGSQQLGSTFLGQGTPYDQAQLLDPVTNSRIAATAIVPAYYKAASEPLPPGYASRVAQAIGGVPDPGFLVLLRTADLSGHTITNDANLPNLWSYYQQYQKAGPTTPPPLDPNNPFNHGTIPGVDPAASLGHLGTNMTGLEIALMDAAQTPEPGAFDIGAGIHKAGVYFFGVLLALLVIGAGIWAWKGKDIKAAIVTAGKAAAVA